MHAAHVLLGCAVLATCLVPALASPCVDKASPGGYTCAEQKKFGKCEEAWLLKGGYCAVTCGRCDPAAASFDLPKDAVATPEEKSSGTAAANPKAEDKKGVEEDPYKDQLLAAASALEGDGLNSTNNLNVTVDQLKEGQALGGKLTYSEQLELRAKRLQETA